MSAQPGSSPAVPLDAVIATDELFRRRARQPEHEKVTTALIALAQTMANAPQSILQKLVETALDLCHAHSAGLSLLEEEDGRKIFRWHGVAGEYAPHLWGTTPREFSPCGTVLDTDKVQLMSHLDRHFGYFAGVDPRIAEALLVPFHVDGTAVGTIWIISHNDETRKFDAEDARVLNTLGEFAAAAYKALSGTIALKSIVATIREPLLVLDGHHCVQSASRSFYETFEVTPEETQGLPLGKLGNGEWDVPSLSRLLDDVLSKGSEIESFAVTRDFPKLGKRTMSLNARKLWSEGNPSALILLAIDDITERKQIEEELLRSNEEAQRFAYVAAHDLRAPLNASVSLLQFLKDKTKLEDEDSRILSMATEGLQRLQALMSDILSYAQLGGAQNRVSVPLHEPLNVALTNLRSDIEKTGAAVEWNSLPTVTAGRSQLILIFQNLISNSIKFRALKSPSIRIGAVKENGQWVVAIADNGRGFDPQYAEQIFLPFKRLHGSDVPGSGIGLASCKRIIEQLGGRIWAEAVPGEGATFRFTIPDISPRA